MKEHSKTPLNDRFAIRVFDGRWSFGQILTCVSIVSILVAIVMPYDTPRPKARLASCMSNEKQLGLAMLGYAEDYDGNLPTGLICPTAKLVEPQAADSASNRRAVSGHSFARGIGWAGSLYSYITATVVFRCPEDKTKTTQSSVGVTLQPVSYSMNQWVPGRPLSALADSSSTVLLFETSGTLANIESPTEAGSPEYSAIGDGGADLATGEPAIGDAFDRPRGLARIRVHLSGALARHHTVQNESDRPGATYLLADGHVKYLFGDQVSVGRRPLPQDRLGHGYVATFSPGN